MTRLPRPLPPPLLAAAAVACALAAMPTRADAAVGAVGGVAVRHDVAPAVAGWTWPVPGHPPRVTRGFDPPVSVYGRGHRGVDLAAAVGAPVRAAGAGVVGYAGLLAGRGVVTVVHGALRTTYEPLTRIAVRRGGAVSRGAVLGRLAAGHAGCPATACLHWGLLRGSTYLDPLTLMGPARVRLLPWSSPPRAATRRWSRAAAARPAPGRSGAAGTTASVLVLGAGAALAAGAVTTGRARRAASREPPASGGARRQEVVCQNRQPTATVGTRPVPWSSTLVVHCGVS